MKKYLQSIAYIIFLINSFVGLISAFISYENPLNIYENPLVWIALVGLSLVVLLKEALNLLLHQKTEQLQLEKEGIDPSTIDKYEWYKKFIKK
ncbi:MAG: cytochrome C oxidase subunit III, partial [Flavobacteriaceae bacterium]|nr:cytochrome C oxidase subunit III [Flavobacteriaceae bacterium]